MLVPHREFVAHVEAAGHLHMREREDRDVLDEVALIDLLAMDQQGGQVRGADRGAEVACY